MNCKNRSFDLFEICVVYLGRGGGEGSGCVDTNTVLLLDRLYSESFFPPPVFISAMAFFLGNWGFLPVWTSYFGRT